MRRLLRVEAVSILAGSLALNWYLQGNWILFAVLAAAPELAWLGYIQRDRKAWWPSLVYNVAHMYTVPIALIVTFMICAYKPWFILGWVANIAAVRAIGWEMKPRKAGRAAVAPAPETPETPETPA